MAYDMKKYFADRAAAPNWEERRKMSDQFRQTMMDDFQAQQQGMRDYEAAQAAWRPKDEALRKQVAERRHTTLTPPVWDLAPGSDDPTLKEQLAVWNEQSKYTPEEQAISDSQPMPWYRQYQTPSTGVYALQQQPGTYQQRREQRAQYESRKTGVPVSHYLNPPQQVSQPQVRSALSDDTLTTQARPAYLDQRMAALSQASPLAAAQPSRAAQRQTRMQPPQTSFQPQTGPQQVPLPIYGQSKR